MVSTIKNVGDFNTKLAEAGDKLVILDFYANWCGPCRTMDPYIQQLVNTYYDRVMVIKVNVDEFETISNFYKIKSMPTFVFIKNQVPLYSFSGADSNLLSQKTAALINYGY